MSGQFEFYDATIPPLLKGAKALHGVLTKAKDSPAAATLPQERIVEDMHPLATQVHIVADWAAKIVSKFNDTEPKTFVREDVKTFDDMLGLSAATIEALAGIDRDTVNKSLGKVVNMKWGEGNSMDLKIEDFILGVAQPNLYFHYAAAYNICRKNGVAVGKLDWIGPHVAHLLQK